MTESKWSREWPTEPGYYWFWGYINADIDNDGLHFCVAFIHAGSTWIKAGNVVVFLEDVQVIGSMTVGQWMPAQTPNIPEDIVTYD